MRANKSKFKRNMLVAVRNWTTRDLEHGVIASVIPEPVSTPKGEQFTMYRYMVKMDNQRDVFGASVRFLFEHELQAVAVKNHQEAA